MFNYFYLFTLIFNFHSKHLELHDPIWLSHFFTAFGWFLWLKISIYWYMYKYNMYIYMYIPGTFLYQCPKNPRLFPFGVTLWNHINRRFPKNPKGRARGAGGTPSRLKGRPAAGSKAWEGFPGCPFPGYTTPLPGENEEMFLLVPFKMGERSCDFRWGVWACYISFGKEMEMESSFQLPTINFNSISSMLYMFKSNSQVNPTPQKKCQFSNHLGEIYNDHQTARGHLKK